MLERSVSGSRVHSHKVRPQRLPTSWISSSSSVQPFQVEALWRDGTQSSTHTTGSSPENVSNGGALPLHEEAWACVAGTGTVRPDDGGMVSVVEELASWTTLGGRTADGTETACCGTQYKAGGGVTTGPCGSGTSRRKGAPSESGPGEIDSTVGGDSPRSHVPLSC